MILYHGSKAIVEAPEIRIQKYNKATEVHDEK